MNKLLNQVQLKEKYLSTLEDEITVKNFGEFIEVTSPFLDRYNDYLQVYVKLINDNEFLLTDDSYIINNLEMSGINMNSSKRKQLLQTILNKYGIKVENSALVTTANSENYIQKLLFLMQAMLHVDDMFMLSQNKVASIFQEDITEFLDKNEIFYSKDVNFVGKSGFIYSYEYLIQRTKNKPERLCKVINNPSKQNFQSTMFMWDDTKKTRDINSKLIVFLNDENTVDSAILDGFKNYDVDTILWSQKEKKLNLLSA